jgi:hypothetical protein
LLLEYLATQRKSSHIIILHLKIYKYAEDAFDAFQWLEKTFYEHDKTAPTDKENKQAEEQLVEQINDGLKNQRFVMHLNLIIIINLFIRFRKDKTNAIR